LLQPGNGRKGIGRSYFRKLSLPLEHQEDKLKSNHGLKKEADKNIILYTL
jgi:hypothetical protein